MLAILDLELVPLRTLSMDITYNCYCGISMVSISGILDFRQRNTNNAKTQDYSAAEKGVAVVLGGGGSGGCGGGGGGGSGVVWIIVLCIDHKLNDFI